MAAMEVTYYLIPTLPCTKLAYKSRKTCARSIQSNQGGTCQRWFGGDADHQPYHDHQGAFCAFLHGHDRQRRGLGYTKHVRQLVVLFQPRLSP